MNDYERQLFNGKCPYSDLPCDKDIECLKCSVEDYERRLYEGESEVVNQMERNNVITTLEVLRTNCSKHSRDYQALDYAISSLKTDEAYQLEYENRDCVEVVRCKDCKHYKGNSCEWHNGFKPPVDWFCADGERE